MNNRLTIQDLAGLLAEKTGKDKGSTERFLREFIAIVSEGVCADKLVKVKGLGVFKIIPVEKRESIHVNTGERFLIPAHFKFSFLPDKELRELVNKPFAFFETTELSDEADFTDLDVSEESEEKEVDDESVEEMIPEEQPLPVAVGTDESVSEPEEVVMESDESVLKPEEVRPESVQPHFRRTRRKRYRPRKKINIQIAIIVILLAVANVLIFLNRGIFFDGSKSQSAARKEMTPAIVAEKGDSLMEVAVLPDTIVQDTTANVMPATQQQPEVSPKTGETAVLPDVIARVKIEAGSRLTLIALEYYGSKHFWVYLYEYNKTKIKDPNNVPIGTEIEVPAPRLYGIDAHNRASVEKATALQTKILSEK